MAVKENDLLTRFPRLWHMAEDGSLDSIREHGLLSTSALLDLYGMKGEERRLLESARRSQSARISKPGLPDATVRDQKPMREEALRKCLPAGFAPEQWFELLNDRAFFWLDRERLRGLCKAKAYRKHPQTVLTIDTASLVKAHRDNVELSPLNSGATLYIPQPRDRDTFRAIADYPFDDWLKKRRKPELSVVELVVRGGVPDISDHLIAAHRVHGETRTELWRRPGTSPDDGP